MGVFKIVVVESLKKTYRIEAKSPKEALSFVEDSYQAGKDDFVLDAGDFDGGEILYVREYGPFEDVSVDYLVPKGKPAMSLT